MKRKTELILLIVASLLWAIFATSYLALKYVPSWYRPVYKSEILQDDITAELTDISRQINNNMQMPQPFTFTISEEQVNRIISGIDYIFPEATDYIPEYISNPAVRFDNDEIQLGAIVEKDSKKIFVSVKIKVSASDKYLILEDIDIYAGLWRLPQSAIKDKVKKVIKLIEQQLNIPDMEKLIEERKIPNVFSFPNSDYDLKILKIEAKGGTLSIQIQPITKREIAQQD